MQCAAYSLSTDMLAALIRLFPKHNLLIWHWARALNFFGRPWWGLFWVEPVLLNRCMVLVSWFRVPSRLPCCLVMLAAHGLGNLCRSCSRCAQITSWLSPTCRSFPISHTCLCLYYSLWVDCLVFARIVTYLSICPLVRQNWTHGDPAARVARRHCWPALESRRPSIH